MPLEKMVFAGIGRDSQVDHVALEVKHGMLSVAIQLFERLGFGENGERRRHGKWGKAAWLEKPGSLPIQLTKPLSSAPFASEVGESHVAIAVKDPRRVSRNVTAWLTRRGVRPYRERWREDVWFVTPLGLLPHCISLEFVKARRKR